MSILRKTVQKYKEIAKISDVKIFYPIFNISIRTETTGKFYQ